MGFFLVQQRTVPGRMSEGAVGLYISVTFAPFPECSLRTYCVPAPGSGGRAGVRKAAATPTASDKETQRETSACEVSYEAESR